MKDALFLLLYLPLYLSSPRVRDANCKGEKTTHSVGSAMSASMQTQAIRKQVGMALKSAQAQRHARTLDPSSN